MKCRALIPFLMLLISVVSCSAPRRSIDQYSGYVGVQEVSTPQQPPELVAYEPTPNKAYTFKAPTGPRPVIIIDPGHGGEDYGTHSLGKPKYHEKYLNMSTAMIVKSFLEQFGFTVILTRTDDTFIPLDKRALFANAQKPTLFVSIHYNSAPSQEAEGIEVFYYEKDEDKTRVKKSKQLAQAVLNRTLKNTQAKSRGVKHGNYAVIRETDMPAILIEGGFLTNADEMEKIKTVPYQKSLALGIAQGVQDYAAKQGLLAN